MKFQVGDIVRVERARDETYDDILIVSAQVVTFPNGTSGSVYYSHGSGPPHRALDELGTLIYRAPSKTIVEIRDKILGRDPDIEPSSFQRNVELRAEVRKAKEEIEELKARTLPGGVADAEKNNIELVERLDAEVKERDRLRGLLKDADASLAEKRRSIEAGDRTYEQLLVESQAESRSLDCLKKGNEELSKDIFDLKKKVKRLKGSVADGKDNLDAVERAHKGLVKTNDALAAEKNKARARHENEIGSMKGILGITRKQRDKSDKALERCRERVDEGAKHLNVALGRITMMEDQARTDISDIWEGRRIKSDLLKANESVARKFDRMRESMGRWRTSSQSHRLQVQGLKNALTMVRAERVNWPKARSVKLASLSKRLRTEKARLRIATTANSKLAAKCGKLNSQLTETRRSLDPNAAELAMVRKELEASKLTQHQAEEAQWFAEEQQKKSELDRLTPEAHDQLKAVNLTVHEENKALRSKWTMLRNAVEDMHRKTDHSWDSESPGALAEAGDSIIRAALGPLMAIIHKGETDGAG